MAAIDHTNRMPQLSQGSLPKDHSKTQRQRGHYIILAIAAEPVTALPCLRWDMLLQTTPGALSSRAPVHAGRNRPHGATVPSLILIHALIAWQKRCQRRAVGYSPAAAEGGSQHSRWSQQR